MIQTYELVYMYFVYAEPEKSNRKKKQSKKSRQGRVLQTPA
jgi:hypothetical protein